MMKPVGPLVSGVPPLPQVDPPDVATTICNVLGHFNLLLNEPFVDEDDDGDPAFDRVYAVLDGDYGNVGCYLTRREILAASYFPNTFYALAREIRSSIDAHEPIRTASNSRHLRELDQIDGAVLSDEIGSRVETIRSRYRSTPLSERLEAVLINLRDELGDAATIDLESRTVRDRVQQVLLQGHWMLFRVLNGTDQTPRWLLGVARQYVDTRAGYLLNSVEEVVETLRQIEILGANARSRGNASMDSTGVVEP